MALWRSSFFSTLAGEDLDVDDGAFDARRAIERSVAHGRRLFSPKIARRSFSSGVRVVSPLGVTLPTRMSPGFTTAPMRMTPLSSRLRRNDSLMLGMSRVTSSGPSLVVAGLRFRTPRCGWRCSSRPSPAFR